MRIEVIVEDPISSQARTYAEYRVFAALAQFAEVENVRHVCVVLRPVNAGHDCQDVVCTVTIALDGLDSFQVRTTGPHAYAAINRAVDRIRTNTPTGIMHRIPG